ncbi:hypothetical protein [Methylomonas albis]|uniref:SH3 domain-containing protein n=1 Tax=Methylomonas albis TaxID=1854563 RepID=A0ABR9CX33_9GAMM|nr:SH3 domain-containing protein [Methylomonas albis]MBD9355441.1 SH3 domain-containing protein [Methylomonas albis]CAD6878421.1 hypothetical protein [Methylomonas albis]
MTENINQVQKTYNINSTLADTISHMNKAYGGNSALMDAFSQIQKTYNINSTLVDTISRMHKAYGGNSAMTNAVSQIQKTYNINSTLADTISRMNKAYGGNSALMDAVSQMQKTYNINSSLIDTINRMNKAYGGNSALMDAVSQIQKTYNINSSLVDTISRMHKAYASNSSLIDAIYQMQEAINASSEFNESSFENDIYQTQFDATLASIAAEDNESAVSHFKLLPKYIQIILLIFLMQILLPVIVSISANLLTPYVEEIIKTERSDKEKLSQLKNIDVSSLTWMSDDLRFISADNVKLRSAPNIKSEIVELLSLGQVVVFIEKQRNWTFVVVHFDNGESASGWIFTRYVARFKN